MTDQDTGATTAPQGAAAPEAVNALPPEARPEKKKNKKKADVKVDSVPQLEGRVTSFELAFDQAGKLQVTFCVKAKKGKPQLIEIVQTEKQHNSAFSALLSAAVATKSKVNVQYAATVDGKKLARCVELIARD